MKHSKPLFTLLGASAFAFAPLSYAASTSIAPIGSYDPYGPNPQGFVAGLDFDDDGHGAGAFFTAPGFLSVPDSGSKSYNLTQNGINFDIDVSNANRGNQNRWRGSTNFVKAGPLMNDFEQWYGDTGIPVEAKIALSGLTPNGEYKIGFYQFNVGAGQTTHSFYDGASSTDPLIGTYKTTGNQNNYATWSPGTLYSGFSDSNGELTVTVQSDAGQRLTLAGLTVSAVAVAVPEPSSTALLGLGGLALMLRRRR